MPCDWEGNRRSDVALAVRHRLQWFIYLRTQGRRKGDEHPADTPHGVRHTLPFTFICNCCSPVMTMRHFYRAMLCIRGTSHGPVSVSVCLCLSVTSRCSTKTAKRRITQTTPHDTQIYFLKPKISAKFDRGHPLLRKFRHSKSSVYR